MKRRTKVVALATSLLVGVSMIGVGFASWVISNNVEAKQSGNVSAESVALADVSLTAAVEGEIKFGSPKDMSNAGAWLTETEKAGVESLTATFTLTMKGVDHIDTSFFVNKNDTSSPSAHSAEWTKATTTLNFVDATVTYAETTIAPGSLSGKTDGSEMYAIDSSTGKITLVGELNKETEYMYSFTVTFKWGTHFGSQNPYAYYNTGKTPQQTRSDSPYGYKEDITGKTVFSDSNFEQSPSPDVTYMEDAWASLNELDFLLQNQKYYFTFTGYSQAEAE